MIIKAWGDWQLFQSLLTVLRAIGDRYGGLSIANIATRWVLDHSFVGAVLIGEVVTIVILGILCSILRYLGARLGLSEHPDENQKVYGFRLSEEDHSIIEAVLGRSNGRIMITSIGDCGAEYR